MANLRMELVLDKQQASWTESYYFLGDPSNLNAYTAAASALAAKRMAFAGMECRIGYVRISNHDLPGQSYLLSFYATLTPIPGTGNDFGLTTPGSSDYQDTAALGRVVDANNLYRKNIFLRGMVDTQIQAGGTYAPDALYRGKVNSYFTFLQTAGYGWLRAAAPQKPTISNCVQNVGDGTVTLTLDAPGIVGPVLNQKIQLAVRKVQGSFEVNGVGLWVWKDATHVVSAKRISIFTVTSLVGAYVRYTTPAFVAIGSGQVMRIVERKAGRPSYQSRGRQKAAARS